MTLFNLIIPKSVSLIQQERRIALAYFPDCKFSSLSQPHSHSLKSPFLISLINLPSTRRRLSGQEGPLDQPPPNRLTVTDSRRLEQQLRLLRAVRLAHNQNRRRSIQQAASACDLLADEGAAARFKAHWKKMKQSKDPFEAAFEEQEDSPPESPADAFETQNPNSIVAQGTLADQEDDISGGNGQKAKTQFTPASAAGTSSGPITTATKNKDDDDEEEEENMDVDLGKFPSSGDPDKMAKMQTILSQFTEEQMSRYESFRRAGFQKANMKRLLASITGTQKISVPMTIVVSGIAKMFVGEIVETARIVMEERKESGPIRPCHLREAYRRLKVEGKVLKRSVSRLFR